MVQAHSVAVLSYVNQDGNCTRKRQIIIAQKLRRRKIEESIYRSRAATSTARRKFNFYWTTRPESVVLGEGSEMMTTMTKEKGRRKRKSITIAFNDFKHTLFFFSSSLFSVAMANIQIKSKCTTIRTPSAGGRKEEEKGFKITRRIFFSSSSYLIRRAQLTDNDDIVMLSSSTSYPISQKCFFLACWNIPCCSLSCTMVKKCWKNKPQTFFSATFLKLIKISFLGFCPRFSMWLSLQHTEMSIQINWKNGCDGGKKTVNSGWRGRLLMCSKVD